VLDTSGIWQLRVERRTKPQPPTKKREMERSRTVPQPVRQTIIDKPLSKGKTEVINSLADWVTKEASPKIVLRTKKVLIGVFLNYFFCCQLCKKLNTHVLVNQLCIDTLPSLYLLQSINQSIKNQLRFL
jgi:hypothetical protein